MLRACFAEDGKLEEMDVMFDGVAVHQQMQKAVGVSFYEDGRTIYQENNAAVQ